MAGRGSSRRRGSLAGHFRLAALKRIFRQEDAAFIRILNGLRNGRLSVEDEDDPDDARFGRARSAEASITHVVLTPNNAAAWKINQLRLAELPGPARGYTAALEGNFEPKAFPTEEVLELKAGARRDDDPQRSVGPVGQRLAWRRAGAGRQATAS